MTLAQAVLTYCVAWWLVLFMVAPVGAAKITDANKKKSWLIKLAATTVLAGLGTWGIDLFLQSGIIQVK